MPKLPPLNSVRDIRLSDDPALEAWIYHFQTENNIEYLLSPSLVASPEQIRFMVALEDDQIYVPCDDALFFLIYRKEERNKLAAEYILCWRFVVGLINRYALNKKDSARILALCRYRFRLFFAARAILPSRLVKRLVSIVLSQCGDPDPFRDTKRRYNRKVANLLADPALLNILHMCPEIPDCASIPRLRQELHLLEISRLMQLATLEPIRDGALSLQQIAREVLGKESLCDCIRKVFGTDGEDGKKILLLPDTAGGFVFDVRLIMSLLRQGHQVVLVLKEAFYFDSPVLWDLEDETLLQLGLERAFVCTASGLSKNELLQLLRKHQFVIISDGLSEQLNLCRASLSFARAWKECDVVMANGRRNSQLFLGSSHEFTRDVICYWRDAEGAFHCSLKARSPYVRKFAEQDILAQAKGIVKGMQKAREAGKTVMFYSAVIGSIPGQTKTAIALVNAFVAHLRNRLENTHIINPAEHFEQGMDGDDLMYMWEQVQRSGYLDVWRFQTVEDIEKSFALLQQKVPSVWSGKDSTFSTGCTKEMRIALDVQASHPELQIIGPAAEKFFRRREYGVGKYFDASLRHA